MYRFWEIWERLQEFLDISGDAWMSIFTALVLYKMMHNGLTMFDATVYGTAVSAFAYSNRQPPKGL
jgi:hypothetical protein